MQQLLSQITQTVGISLFLLSIGAAISLVYINRTRRVDLSLPYGNSLPYVLVLIGAAFLTLGVAGVDGLAITIAAGIFVPFVQKNLSRYLKEET